MAFETKYLEEIVEDMDDFHKYEARFNDKNGPGAYDSDLRLKVGKKWMKINPNDKECLDSEGKPNPAFLSGKPGDIAQEKITTGKKMAEYYVSDYTEKNLDNVFSEAAKDNLKGLYSLVFSLPLEKKEKQGNKEIRKSISTGNTRNDEIRGLIRLIQELGSFYEGEDREGKKKPQQTEEMQQYIYSQIMGEKDTPEFIKECRANSAAYAMANDPDDVRVRFERYHAEKMKELQEKFSESYDKTKLNKGKIINYIRDTIDYLKREEEKEKDEDLKDDLKDAREDIYKNLAQTAYVAIKSRE